MAGLGDNVGLLFRIKADSSDAIKDLNKVQGEVAGVSKGFAGIANPGALAASAITAVAASATAAAIGLFNLAKETSDYGSAIFDATQKTGASAANIQALGYAAAQSGSSLESITASVSKFATLVGQAQLGNEKARATLAQFGVTATEVDAALIQAITSISKMTNATQQNAAAAALFKDRGGDVINTIREMGGDLPGTIAKLEKMGLVMSEADTQAADQFGDTLDNLKRQSAAFTRQMASEFMPSITAAMAAVSRSMAANKEVAQGWGRALAETMDGVTIVYRAGADIFNNVFNAIGAGFLSTAEKARIFAGVMISTLSPVLGILNLIGGQGQLNGSIGGSVNIPDAPISIPRISGGGGGGSRSRASSSSGTEKTQEEINREAFQKEIEALRRILAESEAISDTVMARYERDLELGLIKEDQFTAYRIDLINAGMQARLEALQMEREAAVRLGQDTLDIDSKIAIQKEKIEEQLLKNEKELEQERKKNHEAELKRIEEEAEKRRKAQEADFNRRLKAKEYDERRRLETTIGSGQEIGALDQLMKSAIGDQNTAAIAGIQALSTAFQGLGQAIGQVVQAWVLYGSAGTSVQKVTAMILASIAQQAAVQAVFQLAEGFAKLAMAYFGVPNAGPSAAAHFAAAAMYGSIAGVAAVAGRVVAGNSFAQSTAGGGVGSGAGAQAQQNNNFGGFFNGFQQRQNSLMANITDRTNAVIGAATAAIDRFNEKFGVTTPDVVVMAGAGGASAAIFDATIAQMDKGGGASEAFGRASGRFR